MQSISCKELIRLMPARILCFSLTVTPKQGAAACVVVCKSHCSSLYFMKLMLWSNLSGFSPKKAHPGFGYL